MNKALLICEDTARSASIIHALEEDHDIWQVARHRDAMAWLKLHHPQVVVIDLNLDGLDPVQLIDTLTSEPGNRPAIIGISRTPDSLSHRVTERLDQLINS